MAVVLHVPCVLNVLNVLVSPPPLHEDVEDAEDAEDAEDGAAAGAQALVGASVYSFLPSIRLTHLGQTCVSAHMVSILKSCPLNRNPALTSPPHQKKRERCVNSTPGNDAIQRHNRPKGILWV